MYKVHKFNGKVNGSNKELIDQLIKDKETIDRMVRFIMDATYSNKDDAELEKVVRSYTISMLEYAKY